MGSKAEQWCWGSLCFLFPWIGYVAPKSAAALIVLITLWIVAVSWSRFRSFDWVKSRTWLYILAVLVMAGASVMWTPSTEVGQERWMKIAVFLPLGAILILSASRDDCSMNDVQERALILALVIGLTLLGFHIMSGGVKSVFDRELSDLGMSKAVNKPSVIILMSLSAGLLVLNRMNQGRLGWLYVSALFVLFVLSTSQAALLGLLVWIMAYGFMRVFPQVTIPLLIYGGAALILLHPGMIFLIEHLDAQRSFNLQSASVGARLDIWFAVAHKVLEAPLLGHGIEAVRSITDWSVQFVYYDSREIVHPHNGVLQVWVEFGLIGAVLATGGWIWLAGKVQKFDVSDQPAIVAALSAGLTVLCVSHGLWQSWWINAIFGAAALTILSTRKPSALAAPAHNIPSI